VDELSTCGEDVADFDVAGGIGGADHLLIHDHDRQSHRRGHRRRRAHEVVGWRFLHVLIVPPTSKRGRSPRER
jgi:hypothetical protein